MRTESATTALAVTILNIHLAAKLRGTSPLTEYSGFPDSIILPDVSNNVYTDILSVSYGVEDVGILEVINAQIGIQILIKGDGAARCQISGDGGNTWNDIFEVVFNVGDFGSIYRTGSGAWITSIDTGENKLQIRIQTLAHVGTINTILNDASSIGIQYRQKLFMNG